MIYYKSFCVDQRVLLVMLSRHLWFVRLDFSTGFDPSILFCYGFFECEPPKDPTIPEGQHP